MCAVITSFNEWQIDAISKLSFDTSIKSMGKEKDDRQKRKLCFLIFLGLEPEAV